MNIKFLSICLLVFIINGFFSITIIAQDCDANTCLIRLTSGGSVNFKINSLNKYNEGVEYQDWTRIAISFEDGDATKLWNLEFKALSIEIIGDGGKNIDLNYISLIAIDGGGITNLGDYIEPEKTLDNSYKTIVVGAPQGDFNDNIIAITYKCGKDPENIDKLLLGEYPGYYVVDIEFKLSVAE